jgi:hypothetical protein
MHEIELGDVTVTRIEETHGPIMPTRAFFPTMPGEAWQEHRDLLVPDHLGADDDMVNVAMQSWLLRSEGRTILIDTGIGNDKHRPAVEPWHQQKLDYLGRLAAAGPGTSTWSSTHTCTLTTSAGTPAWPTVSGCRPSRTPPT